MPVVTIDGQMGSGGREIGLIVASILGTDCFDQAILEQAAQRLGATVQAVEEKHARPARVRDRVVRFLTNFLERSAAAGSAGDPFLGPTGIEELLSRSYPEAAKPPITRGQELEDKRFLEVHRAVLRDLASTGNAVIIGRGGVVELHDWPGALHVYTVAPLEQRIRRVMQRLEMDRATAEKHTHETETARLAYFRKYFKVDAGDPLLYHLVLNTAQHPPDFLAQVIVEASRAIQPAAK
ncbi:MAG: cytidylate kinase-like family protein [Chloroflexi bacterium]|nr:cytidylate kinase-like family protein [Chloroflexota bacterium]